MRHIFKSEPWSSARRWLCSFILFIVLSFYAGSTVWAVEFTVADANAVLYTAIPIGYYPEPDSASVPIAISDAGTPVQVTGITSNGWFRIEAGGTFYVPGNALALTPPVSSASNVTAAPTVPVSQYKDTAEYTVGSSDAALAARNDAISSHASQVKLHKKGVSGQTITDVFCNTIGTPVCDYSTANVYGVELRGVGNEYVINYYYLSTIEEEIYTDAAVAQLVPRFNTGTTYDKILTVHDYICNNVSYSYDTVNGTADFRSAYDALYYNTTVCSGYALLFQKFMDYMGIPCYVATGTINGVGHAWNLVNIDGQWYHIDCTNDDQNYGISRHYFLKGASFAGPAWGNIPISPNDYKH